MDIAAEIEWVERVVDRDDGIIESIINEQVKLDELQIAENERPDIAALAMAQGDSLWLQLVPDLDAMRPILARIREFRATSRRRVILVSGPLVAAGGLWAAYMTTPWPAKTLVSIGLAVVAFGVAVQNAMDLWFERRKAYRAFTVAQPRFRTLVVSAVDALLRTVLNIKKGGGTGELLFHDKAPTLVELASYRDHVPSGTYDILKDFILEHDTSAIGLSGPRGVGKTTAMRRLHYDESLNCLDVYVPVPVAYSAPDLVRLIEHKLADAVLKHEGVVAVGRYPRLWRRQSLAGVYRIAVAVLRASWWTVLLGGGLALVALDNLDELTRAADRITVGLPTAAGIVVSALALFALGRTLWRQASRMSARGASIVGQIAYDRKMDLSWQEAIQRGAKLSGPGKSWSGEVSAQVKHSQREASHAENVSRLRDFFGVVHEHTGKRIIVCVDELDKISPPDKAIELVNDLKDLLHVEHSHFVISVSTDAMHNFAMRGVPLRDVFDSALDAVVAVERLTYQESRELLNKRVLYFPDAAVAFCHVWSGGHARDLIRTARSMVDAKRRAQKPAVPIVEIVEEVMRRDIHDAMAAMYSSLPAKTEGPWRETLTKLLGLLRDRQSDLAVVLKDFDAPATKAGSPEVAPIPVYLALAQRTWALIREPRNAENWQHEATPAIEEIERIADARWILSSRPQDAEALLRPAGAQAA